MTNTANIRFEPSNVAHVNVDLETHEMTGGVMDETTGIFYPIGGGGGSNITPILSLTLTEDSNSYTVPKYCIVDGEVMEDEIEIEAGKTANILITNEGSNFIYLVTEDSSSLTYAITDLVNCTKLENEGSIGLMITDPSQNASATMKISGGIG